jgi:hypothetical protein
MDNNKIEQESKVKKVNPKEVNDMVKEMDLCQLYERLLPLLEDSISAFELARWTENFQYEKQAYQEAVDIIKNFYFQIKENYPIKIKEEVLYVIKLMQERFYWILEEYYKEQLEELTKDFELSEFRNILLQKIHKSIRLLDEARDIKEDEDLTEEEKEEQIKLIYNEIISYFEEVYTDLVKNEASPEDFDTLFFTLEILQVIAAKDMENDLRQELIEIQNKIREKFKYRYKLRYR